MEGPMYSTMHGHPVNTHLGRNDEGKRRTPNLEPVDRLRKGGVAGR